MIVVNLAHRLRPEHLAQLETLVGEPPARLIEHEPHFDEAKDLAPQVADLVDGLGLTAEEWQAGVVVRVPGFAPAAACLMAELHGRLGHFPSVLRLREVEDPLPRWEVAEVINLSSTRKGARLRRGTDGQ